jgi:hypothetical protein
MSDKCVVCEKNDVEPLWDITCRPCSDDWNEYIKETMVDDSEIVELSIEWAANRAREKLSTEILGMIPETISSDPIDCASAYLDLISELRELIATRQLRRNDKPGESQED